MSWQHWLNNLGHQLGYRRTRRRRAPKSHGRQSGRPRVPYLEALEERVVPIIDPVTISVPAVPIPEVGIVWTPDSLGTGSLLSNGFHPFHPQWVLTAAHVVEDYRNAPGSITFESRYSPSGLPQDITTEIYFVDQIIVHPSYNLGVNQDLDPFNNDFRHDIALIHLTTPSQHTNGFRIWNDGYPIYFTDPSLIHIGYGLTNGDDPYNPPLPTLRWGVNNLVLDDYVYEHDPSYYVLTSRRDWPIPPFGTYGGSIVAPGDSGGPSVINAAMPSTLGPVPHRLLVGVHSFGDGDREGIVGDPTYTYSSDIPIGQYFSWIDSYANLPPYATRASVDTVNGLPVVGLVNNSISLDPVFATYSGRVASFFDIAGSPRPGTSFGATIDWGDGVTSEGQIVDTVGGSYDVVGYHAYQQSGDFQITVTINGDASPSEQIVAQTMLSVASLANKSSEGQLVANVGALAARRHFEDGSLNQDVAEYMVFEAINANDVLVTWTYGASVFEQVFFGVTEIVADSGAGDDVMSVRSGVPQQATLRGGTGDDVLDGGGGNDQIFGDSGNDTLLGGLENDTILGGDGADSILGGHGDDVLGGENDSDTLHGEQGHDTIFGGGGGDLLVGDFTTGSSSTDTGNDVLFGDGQEDPLLDGNDTIFGGGSVELSVIATFSNAPNESGEGTDSLYGGGGQDFLYGGRGGDQLNGNTGTDSVYGGPGDDRLMLDFAGIETSAADHLNGGLNFDTLAVVGKTVLVEPGGGATPYLTDVFDDVIELSQPDPVNHPGDFVAISKAYVGGPVTDSFQFFIDGTTEGTIERLGMSGLGGNDVLTAQGVQKDLLIDGGTGNDVLTGGDGRDSIVGGDGDDVISGGIGDDVLQGDAGRDSISGDTDDDVLYGGDETPVAGEADDTLDGGDGRDVIYAGDGNDIASAGPGINGDLIYGGGGNDTLTGGDGKDYLVGEEGDDYLEGGNLGDILLGEDGADTLVGGGGRDALLGGDDADKLYTYLVGVTNTEAASTESWIATYQLLLGREIEIIGISAYLAQQGIDPNGPIGQALILVFGSLTGVLPPIEARLSELDGLISALLALPQRTSSEEALLAGYQNEQARLTTQATLLQNELVQINETQSDLLDKQTASIDLADGGDGDDELHGTQYPDFLVGGEDNDTIYHSAGNDTITGGNGTNDLYAFEATEGNDTIVAALGDAGGGNLQATVTINGLPMDGIKTTTPTGVNQIDIETIGAFGLGGNDLFDVDFGNQATFKVYFDGGAGNDTIDAGDSLDQIQVDNFRAAFPLQAQATLIGGDGNDTIIGGLSDDLIDGCTGDDSLVGGAGNDKVLGGLGNDFLAGGAPSGADGNDTLIGADGDDTLLGGDGPDLVVGGTGSDSAETGLDNDTIIAGTGNDSVTNAGGVDVTQLLHLLQQVDDGNPDIEFGIDDVTFFEQVVQAPSVAVSPGRFFIATWSDDGDIYARRFAPTGQPIGSQFRINVRTQGVQSAPAIAMTADGTFIVAWTSDPNGSFNDMHVRARRFNPDGTAIDLDDISLYNIDDEGQITGAQYSPSVSTNGQDLFLVAWVSTENEWQDARAGDIYGRRLDAHSSSSVDPIPFLINSREGDADRLGRQDQPSVAMASDGSFIAAWASTPNDSGNSVHVRVRRFNAQAQPLEDDFAIHGPESSEDKTGYQTAPSVTVNNRGSYLIAWVSTQNDHQSPRPGDIYGRRLSVAGGPREEIDPAEFLISTSNIGRQDDVCATAAADGSFFVTWASQPTDDSNDGFVAARRFDEFGSPVGSDFQLNFSEVGRQDSPAAAMTPSGDVVAVWRSFHRDFGNGDIVGAIFDAAPPTVVASPNSNSANTIWLRFSEELSTTGPQSVLLTSNWQLTRDGVQLGISGISQFINESTGAADVRIDLSMPLTSGNYQLVARAAQFDAQGALLWGLSDVAKRALDGDADGVAGDDLVVEFAVYVPEPRILVDAASLTEGTNIDLSVDLSMGGTTQFPEEIVSYEWLVTLNGQYFDGGTGTSRAITPSDNGTYVITVTVIDIDGDVGTDQTTLVIDNVVPTGASAGIPSGSVRGEQVNVTIAATDPSSVDQAAPFTFDIDWDNDGVFEETVTGLSGTTVSHVFDSSGAHTVNVRATDKDGGIGAVASQTITVSDWVLRVDPLDSNKTDLHWGGSAGNDHYVFENLDDTTVQVRDAGGAILQTISGVTGKLYAYGGKGNDTLVGTAGDNYLDGGDGNDTIYGDVVMPEQNAPYGQDIIFGGAGDDILYGDGDGGEGAADLIHAGDGNDTVYGDGSEGGATGTDTIFGGDGDDMLIGDQDGAEGAGDQIHGEIGNDFIKTGNGSDWADGGDGDDILLGGDGGEGADDTLLGGTGREILVGDGGRSVTAQVTGGSDSLNGGAGEDIIIAGVGIPVDAAAMAMIQAEWTSERTFAERVANISGMGSGPNANGSSYLQPGTTVFNDRPSTGVPTLVDQVFGGTEADWIFSDIPDDNEADLEGSDLLIDLATSPRP